jgi:hypothetical protein
MGDRRASIKIEFSMHGETKEADMWINWSPSDCNGVDQRILDFFSESAREMESKFWKAQPPEPRNFCPRCGKRAQGVLGQPQVHTCTPPLWGYK